MSRDLPGPGDEATWGPVTDPRDPRYDGPDPDPPSAKHIAYLDWSLDVVCPNCGESNDLTSDNHDVDNTLSTYIFTNQWHKCEGFEVTCEHCDHEFELSQVEH